MNGFCGMPLPSQPIPHRVRLHKVCRLCRIAPVFVREPSGGSPAGLLGLCRQRSVSTGTFAARVLTRQRAGRQGAQPPAESRSSSALGFGSFRTEGSGRNTHTHTHTHTPCAMLLAAKAREDLTPAPAVRCRERKAPRGARYCVASHWKALLGKK